MVRHSVHRHQQANLSTKIIASTKTSRQHTMPELYQGIYQSRGNTTSASAARGRAKRTFSTVAGAALPGEEAEGTLPRVRELAVRHPRLTSPPLLTCTTQKSSSDPPQNQQERLSSQHRGDEMVATDGCGKSRRKGRECWIDPNGRLTEWDQVSNPVRSRALIGGANRLMVVGPVALRVYKRWKGAGGHRRRSSS
jgi:hypothetical protein